MCSTVEEAVDAIVAAAAGPDEEILALTDLIDRAQARLVDRAGAFDAAQGHKADGAYSFACWLRARADVTRAESLQLERLARRLRTMPATQEALKDGKLSVAKARVLASAINDRTKDTFAEHEAFLVGMVQAISVDLAKVAVDFWRRQADTDGPDPSDPDRNRASLTCEYNGRWHLEADLDPVNGALLNALLQAIEDRLHGQGRFADWDPAVNTAGRRKAEALIEAMHRASGPDPERTALHPDVIVNVPADALRTGEPDPFDPPTVIGGGPITMGDLYRFAMLGTVSAMLTDPTDGRPLHLGRKVRLATGDQWIAGTIWHQGCVIPGCDRPAAWCQAHHDTFWANGGVTDLVNLPFVCCFHHHLIHDDHWTITPQPDGTWHLNRPDGTTVPPPRYPGNHKPRPRARPPD
jgi:hypothetical protein